MCHSKTDETRMTTDSCCKVWLYRRELICSLHDLFTYLYGMCALHTYCVTIIENAMTIQCYWYTAAIDLWCSYIYVNVNNHT